MDSFNADNRCPTCGGDASYTFHGHGLGCTRIAGDHMHRRCEDCGFRWGELPVRQASPRKDPQPAPS
jgi:hypothetical protein